MAYGLPKVQINKPSSKPLPDQISRFYYGFDMTSWIYSTSEAVQVVLCKTKTAKAVVDQRGPYLVLTKTTQLLHPSEHESAILIKQLMAEASNSNATFLTLLEEVTSFVTASCCT